MNNWLDGFRVRLAVGFGGLSLALGFAVTLYLNSLASDYMTGARGDTLDGIARSAAHSLAETLREREREIVLLSQRPLLTRGDFDAADLRAGLEQILHTYRHYAWIGVADPSGVVRVAADRLLEGEQVARRPWFIGGCDGPFFGDVHEAVLLAKRLQAPNPGEPLRFVDFAAPIRAPDGTLRGVVATHAHWALAGEVLRATLPVDAASAGIEAYVVSRDGALLYPYEAVGHLVLPAALPDPGRPALLDWPAGSRFLTARQPVRSELATDPGWQIVIRQPLELALAPVTALHRALLALGGLAALLLVLLAFRIAASFARPVETLAAAAARIGNGDEATPLAVRSDIREIRGLADSLRRMADSLIGRRRALEAANISLEEKVAARTAELAAANHALEQLARRDALTGLLNRRAADEMLNAEFQRLKRSGHPYCVLLVDIDHFKQVNDRHGHDAGDRVLRAAACVLAGLARATDCVARFGGEEFLLLLPGTGHAGALVLAEKIRATMADTPFPEVGRITLSIGVDEAMAEDDSPARALGRADARLYRAKAEGRNRVIGGGDPPQRM